MALAEKEYKKCCDQDIEMTKNQRSENESLPAITVLGTGDFGRALTKRLLLAGYDVVIGSRDPAKRKKLSHLMAYKIVPFEKALEHSDVIFFAIPRDGYEEMITKLGDKLEGNSYYIVLSPK